MTRRPRRSAALAATAAMLVATTACSSDDSGNSAPASGDFDRVTYATAFGETGRDAFAWVAQELGYFEEAGIEVEIIPGAGTGPNLDMLTAREVDIASLDITGATIEAGNGDHTEFRVVAALHQSTLVAIISLEGYGVTSPQDLEGKQLGAGANTVNQLLFPAYAAVAGIDEAQVEWVNVPPPELPGLLASGDVDALSTFLIGARGIEVAADGQPSVLLPYSEYLTDLYGNGIMATTALIEENPDLVVRFRDALLRALQWSVDNPEEAAQILNQATDAGLEAALGEIEAMTPAVLAAGTVGVIDEVQVARAITLLQGAGLIPSGLRPEDIVAFDLAPTL